MSGNDMAPHRMVEHELKCWPEFFDAVVALRKPFEIRKNDRNYQVGDVLWLREFIPQYPHAGGDEYTGREVRKRVTYMTDWEQKPGYVVMGLSTAPL